VNSRNLILVIPLHVNNPAMRAYWLALLSLPFALAAKPSDQQRLVELADANNGVIPLDDATFSLLTSPNRNWSSAILFTALDPRRRCSPCKFVEFLISSCFGHSCKMVSRDFNPSWNAVGKAWSSTKKEHRDDHFFATLDFDIGQTTFQKVYRKLIEPTKSYFAFM
jgi:oligosaccharyltransferase complex subunit gamma